MKFVIEFGEDDLVKFIDEFGDDLKEGIKKRLKDALIEEQKLKSDDDDVPTVHKKMLDSKEEAENVLLDMQIILDKFHYLTLRDYYDLLGLQTLPDDDYYGWTNLEDAVVSSRPLQKCEQRRWYIELPKPVRLHRHD